MTATDAEFVDRTADLDALVGTRTGPVVLSPHAVNEAMIRHWVEAMGDDDPVYVSDEAARAEGLGGAIAPPTMLQAWSMRGLRATLQLETARAEGRLGDEGGHEQLMAILDGEGLTSVVATNCDQTYARPLVIGDRLLVVSVIESVSDRKETGLGHGRFVTTRSDFVAVPDAAVGAQPDPEALFAEGEPVASMRFRILKFAPKASPAQRPKRPRPTMTEDIAFWFEGAKRHELLIQRCVECGQLRHPPLPACPSCRSFRWDTVRASGRGTVYSFVVTHYPQLPAFDYPLPIGLIELEEGTRLVADLDGIDPARWEVGMEVVAEFVEFDEDLTLPVFRPDDGGGA